MKKFVAQKVPKIKIQDFIMRFYVYASCSELELSTTLIYVDRLVREYSCEDYVILTELTIHRIVLTAILLSIKFLQDDYYDNKFYATVGGVPTRELNLLERHMF